MRRVIGWLGSLVLVSAIVIGAPSIGAIKWEKSYDQALKLAAKTDRIVMIDFYTDWCGWCKKLDQTAYKDKAVIEESKNLVCLKIDSEAQTAVSQKYGIESFPTIVFTDSTGAEVLRSEGYLEPVDFLAAIKKAVKNDRDFHEAQERVKQNPQDVEASYLLACACYDRKKLKEGEEYMQKVLTLDAENKRGHTPELYMRAGLAHGMSRDFKRAIELFSRGVEKYPLSPYADETGLYLGLSYEFDNQTARAREIYQRVMKSAKSDRIQKSAQRRLNELAGKG